MLVWLDPSGAAGAASSSDEVTGAPAPAGGDAQPCALVIGNLDGVHRGHQAVLAEARALAGARGLGVAVLTFEPHPAAVVGAGGPPVLTTLGRKGELLLHHGADRVYVQRFDRPFADWSPERFVRDLVHARLRGRLVLVGENFRFGARRRGDLDMLRAMGEELGFEVRVHSVIGDAAGPYSSTRARDAIVRGDVRAAAHVLGRPHRLSGVVVEGDRLGRTLGFPTANLGDVPELLPPHGVYAVRVHAAPPAGGPAPAGGVAGVMNIGVRPTVAGGLARTIEAHLLDFAGDLYGARVAVEVRARLRDERRFDGTAALKEQIARDVLAARAALLAE